ncbi:MAG: HAMP domain-containing histidine kinase [Rhodospirillaceae bacterium]|nr:MAG: HAMP domain-containing histidine kinase [Rhodospirillaceae bacterium]
MDSAFSDRAGDSSPFHDTGQATSAQSDGTQPHGRNGLGGIVSQFSRSVRVQLVALLLIFSVPPVLLYSVFKAAELDKQSLLLEAVRENDRTVGRALAPLLQAMQPGDFSRIPQELARFESDQRNIKVLFKPAEGGAGFFYVASAPEVATEQLAAERQQLIDLGVLPRLEGSCSGNVTLGDRVALPGGGGQMLMAVTPVQSPKGCWVVVVSAAQDAVAALIDGRPYWTRPETRMAGLIYATMAVLVFLIFAAVWSALARFRRTAATVEQGRSFATITAVPELAQLAKEFDAMVARLRRTTDVLRQAAEDNAHAFKGPIAVIRQATEFVSRNVADPGTAGINAITASLNRLEGLVRSAQRLDTATADMLETGWALVNLSELVRTFIAEYQVMLGPRNGTIVPQISPNLYIAGREDMIETILENLIDNAISFSPEGGQVEVTAMTEDGKIVVSVADEGPGVAPDQLVRIFDRYYSSRPSKEMDDAESIAETNGDIHFGIGLWLVQQHVQAMGGTVEATNQDSGGLRMTVRIPMAGTNGSANGLSRRH